VKSQKAPVLSTEVFTTLKERIIRWEYPPAHRLTEEELCEEFGASRSPIREALHMLVENGLITKEPYRGYSVKQPDLKEIQDLYDVRQALEVFAVEWLVIHGMPETEWTELHNTWQGMLQNLPQVTGDFAKNDEAFHEKLAECTGNQALTHYLHNVNERLHFIRMTDITTTARLCVTCEQHLQILEWIKKGDARLAGEAVRTNIEGGRQQVDQAVKEALSRSYLGYHRGE
jgi:DNA-binding GntR family transcriptional regulator